MIRTLHTAIAATTLVALVMATPSGAETAAAAKPSDTAEITIFARQAPARHTYAAAQQEMAASDPHFSCALYLKKPTPGYKQEPFVDGGAGTSAGPGANILANPNCVGVTGVDRRMQILIHNKTLPEAYAAYEAGDYAKALPLFIEAYSRLSVVTSPQTPGERGQARTFRGIPAAAVMAARMYFYGQGTAPDTAKAIVWFTKAANEPTSPDLAGDGNTMSSQVEAALFLARIYETGTDVDVNPKEARKWYLRAAELNYAPAQHLCGLIYRSGYGGEKNMSTAMQYFTSAGKAGYAPAQYTLGEIYYSGEDGVMQDKTRAGAWLLLAAKNGYPDALYAVGRMYDLGEGGATMDPAKALVYYKEAAVKGQPDAENVVGLSFYTGNGVAQDAKLARQWFEKASEQANVDAMFSLSVMLINGEGGDKDYVKAWVWLKVADAGGHPKAGAALAELEAKMTPEDLAKAKALFQPAT